MKEEMISPFSNGSEFMLFYDEYCCRCVKAWFPKKDGDWPSEKTLRKYVSMGKYCKLQYEIDLATITSEIKKETADEFGLFSVSKIYAQCQKFSNNDDDRFKPPKQPKPDKTDPGQIVMPLNDLFPEPEIEKEFERV